MSGPMPRRDLESNLQRLVAQAATAQDKLFNEQERLRPRQEELESNLQFIARLVSRNRSQIFIGGASRAEVNGLWVYLDEKFELVNDGEDFLLMSPDEVTFYESLAKLASSAGVDAAGTSAEVRELALKVPYLRRTERITIEDQSGREFAIELKPSTN